MKLNRHGVPVYDFEEIAQQRRETFAKSLGREVSAPIEKFGFADRTERQEQIGLPSRIRGTIVAVRDRYVDVEVAPHQFASGTWPISWDDVKFEDAT